MPGVNTNEMFTYNAVFAGFLNYYSSFAHHEYIINADGLTRALYNSLYTFMTRGFILFILS